MDSKDVKIIAKSEWKPAEVSTLAGRIVVWDMQAHSHPAHPNRSEFATHMEIEYEDGTRGFSAGHYHLGMGAAVQDFEDRCRILGVPAFPIHD